MPLETFGNIDDLVPANPDDDDLVLEGAAHLRGIKLSLQGNVTGDDAESRLVIDGVPTLIARRPGVDDPLLALRNALDDGDLVVLAYDAASDTFRISPLVGGVVLETDGLPSLATQDFGAQLFRPGAPGSRLEFHNEDDGVLAQIQSAPSGQLNVGALVDGRGVRLTGQQIGGANVDLLDGDPAGNMKLFDNGIETFRTSAAGANCVRPGAASPTLGFNNDGGVIAQINANDAGPLVVQAFKTSRGIELRGTNSADATIVALSHDPNAGVFIRGPDNTNHLTVNNAGITVNGQATASDLAPTASAHLTRKDYVDGVASGPTAQQQIKVGQMQILTGTDTAVGSTVTVVFAVPFTSTPNIAGEGVAATVVQTRLITRTNTGFTAQVSVTNAGYSWVAMGSNTA